jgi:hypothetical protein
LKPKHDELLSSFAFKFNLRRYTKGWVTVANATLVPVASEAGAYEYTRPLFGST